MAQIEVSPEIHKAFEQLKEALQTIYPQKKISDDEIMGAMIGGFFDSLSQIQQNAHAHHHHHDGDHECCGDPANCSGGGAGKCKDDGECKCK